MFPSCSERGLLSSCRTKASYCSSLSCWVAPALGCVLGLQELWQMGLVAPRHVGIFPDHLPRPGIKPVSSALAGRFLITGPQEKSSIKPSSKYWRHGRWGQQSPWPMELPFFGGKWGGWQTDNKQGKKNSSMPGQVYQWVKKVRQGRGVDRGCVGWAAQAAVLKGR